MTAPSDDTAVLQVLLDRLLKVRLPRAMELRQRVYAGERLSDTDIAFLKDALEDAQNGQHYVARNPQFHKIGIQLAQLYDEIIQKATENEEGAGSV